MTFGERGARLAGLSLTLAIVGCPSPPKPPPKAELPPLVTTMLGEVVQGPGARWSLRVRPEAIAKSPIFTQISSIAPADGFDRLDRLVGFPTREVPEALIVGYASSTVYAATLPKGTSPDGAIAAFEKRMFPPNGRASPRPDLVRVWGSTAAGGRASLVGLWSTKGDSVVGESGRLGPVAVTMALSTGKLSVARALSTQAPFVALAAWAGDAPFVASARCPLGDVLGSNVGTDGSAPIVVQECDGAALTLRPLPAGKLALAIHLTGRWGSDADAARAEVQAIVDRIRASDLGKALALRDVVPTVTATKEAVDVAAVLDATALANGIRALIEPDLRTLLH